MVYHPKYKKEKYVRVGELGWELRYGKLGIIKKYKEGLVWVLKYYMGVEVKRWKSVGLGKLMCEIDKEVDVNEVVEKEEEELGKEERRKGWKKYIWE